MMFQILGPDITPLSPDSTAVIDNVTVYDLAGAVKKSGKPKKYLVDLHVGFFGHQIPDDPIVGESRPAKKSKASVVRLSDGQREQYAREALYGNLSDAGWATFKSRCDELKLSINCRQLHPIERIDGNTGELLLHVIVGIDAMGALAKRTKDYKGFKTEYCGDDKVWTDTWSPNDPPPMLCRVHVFIESFREPVVVDVAWKSYAPFVNTSDGQELDPSWQRWGFQQLAKCGLALGLRRGVPEALAGVYCPEEMKQMDNFQPDPTKSPKRPERQDDSQVHADCDSQLDETIDEDDFQSLLRQAVPNPAQRVLALSSYKIKYKALWNAQSHRFYVVVARDLREMIRQREAG